MPIRGTPLAEITTLSIVVDGIQADLDNTTDGLGALKTHIKAIPSETYVEMVKVTEARANEKYSLEDREER